MSTQYHHTSANVAVPATSSTPHATQLVPSLSPTSHPRAGASLIQAASSSTTHTWKPSMPGGTAAATTLSQRLRRAIIDDDLPRAKRLAAQASALSPPTSAASQAEGTQHRLYSPWQQDLRDDIDSHTSTRRPSREVQSLGVFGPLTPVPSAGPQSGDEFRNHFGNALRAGLSQPRGSVATLLAPDQRWVRNRSPAATSTASSGERIRISPEARAIASQRKSQQLASGCAGSGNSSPPFDIRNLEHTFAVAPSKASSTAFAARPELDGSKSSLALATIHGASADMVKWLIEQGHESGDFSRDATNTTILHLAASHDRPDIIEACAVYAVAQAATSHAQRYTFPSPKTAASTGAQAHNSSLGADNASRDPPHSARSISTAMSSDLSHGSDAVNEGEEIPRALKELLDWQDNQGRTALQIASMKGYLEAARLLIDLGADPNLCDIEGNSPLHHASSWGHLIVVQLLIERGCTFAAQNLHGFTAADYAFTPYVKEALEAFGRAQYEGRRMARKRGGPGGGAFGSGGGSQLLVGEGLAAASFHFDEASGGVVEPGDEGFSTRERGS